MVPLNNSGTLPFTLVDGTHFTNEFTIYELLKMQRLIAKEMYTPPPRI